jgi:hypothetical protein
VHGLVLTSSPVFGAASASANLGPITVQEQDAFANPTTAAEAVNLTSTSNGTAVFSSSLNGPTTTTVDIAGGASSTTFYYGDELAGTPSITVSATNNAPGTQGATIAAGAAASLCFSDAPACTGSAQNVGHGGTGSSHLSLVDLFGNLTRSDSDVSITITPSGSGSVAPTGTDVVTIHAGSTTSSQSVTLTGANPPGQTVVATASIPGSALLAATMAAST